MIDELIKKWTQEILKYNRSSPCFTPIETEQFVKDSVAFIEKQGYEIRKIPVKQKLECLNTKCRDYKNHCGCSLKKVTLDCYDKCMAKDIDSDHSR